MGCGISRFSVDDGTGCGGLRSPLRRRLDEVRKTDGDAIDLGTNSTKLLLKDAADQSDAASNSNSNSNRGNRKSVSGPHPSGLNEPPPLQKINTRDTEITTTDDNINNNIITNRSNITTTDNNNNNNNGRGFEKAKEGNDVGRARVPVFVRADLDIDDDNHEDHDYDDDDKGRRISDFDGSLWIGSPSFREYCVHDSDSEDNAPISGKGQGEKRETILVTQGSEKFTSSDEGSKKSEQADKRETRGSRFRKVFPLHRRNFWHGRNGPPKIAGKVA